MLAPKRPPPAAAASSSSAASPFFSLSSSISPPNPAPLSTAASAVLSSAPAAVHGVDTYLGLLETLAAEVAAAHVPDLKWCPTHRQWAWRLSLHTLDRACMLCAPTDPVMSLLQPPIQLTALPTLQTSWQAAWAARLAATKQHGLKHAAVAVAERAEQIQFIRYQAAIWGLLEIYLRARSVSTAPPEFLAFHRAWMKRCPLSSQFTFPCPSHRSTTVTLPMGPRVDYVQPCSLCRAPTRPSPLDDPA